MLKLVFSPYYDGNCYAGNPKRNKCTLGTKYVGPLGLLTELELRAGLSRGETTPMERTIAYCKAVRVVLNGTTGKPFYKQSFENDPLGVAQLMLGWRDALCMAGWDSGTKLYGLSTDGMNRLGDLADIEGPFSTIGVGERWRELLAEATNRNILPSDVAIEVDMKMELLKPIIRKVLEEIRNKGGNVSESEVVRQLGDKPLGEFANKFTLYEFPEQNDAYQWAALQGEIDADVYINEDNFTFNQVLKSVGKPLVSASVGGATDLSLLLKLGISLFRNPVNYTNLKNYLDIFRHPIDWATRSALRYHLKKVGGLGDMVNKDGTTTQINDTAKNYSDFWGMWDNGTKDANGMDVVHVDKVKGFCKKLLEWAEKEEKSAEAEKNMSPMTGTQLYAQLVLLQERIKLMLSFLDGRSGDIGNDELDKVATLICQGGLVNTDYARLGSADMLSDLKGLATEVNTVIWMDCVRKPRPRYDYAFLNPSDIKKLQKQGLDIPNADLEILAADFAERLAVSRAGKIIALMPQRKDGERAEENLIITELRCTAATTIPINTPSLPKGVSLTEAQADTQKVEHNVDAALFANIDKPAPKTYEGESSSDPSKFIPKPIGYQREYESFSSLSELINQPFDYVLDYIYKMRDEDGSNLSTVEGNVAHKVINQMVKASTNASKDINTNDFITLCRNAKGLKQMTNQAILDVGAILLQPENEMECNIFKRIFIEKSIPTLARIIEDNDLEVVGSEIDITTMLKDSVGKDAFMFNAKIDFLLKKKNEDKYYIFDFKWTGSPKKRVDELEGCKELQLALYEKIAEANEKSPVVMRGYYMLKHAQLLTVYNGFNLDDSIRIVKQNKSYDIFEQAVASYRERIQNLKDGYIEEGEEMEGAEFENTEFIKEFIKEQKKKSNLYYLNNGLEYNMRDKKMKKTAKSSSYGKNTVLKGKIK